MTSGDADLDDDGRPSGSTSSPVGGGSRTDLTPDALVPTDATGQAWESDPAIGALEVH